MNDRLIAQLETRLEKITEGIFAHFFGKRIQAYDIALHLARALEDGLEPAQDGDTRPLAPDEYLIRTNPEILEQIIEHYPALAQVLSNQIVDFAASAGYRLRHIPDVRFVSAPEVSPTEIVIIATHMRSQKNTTQALQPITPPSTQDGPLNPQLLIGSQQSIPLEKAIVHIGRSTENDLVIDDAYVSRFHAQIRLRFGHYVIFDTDSQSGTYVNDVRIREYQLHAGDVIRIGKTNIVYMEDDPSYLDQTDAFNRS